MDFEWDERKNKKNIEKHGVSFEDALHIFEGPTLDVVDTRYEYGEKRVISIGKIGDMAIVTVVHTDRNGKCRIISARPSKQKERIRYDEAIRQATYH